MQDNKSSHIVSESAGARLTGSDQECLAKALALDKIDRREARTVSGEGKPSKMDQGPQGLRTTGTKDRRDR